MFCASEPRLFPLCWLVCDLDAELAAARRPTGICASTEGETKVREYTEARILLYYERCFSLGVCLEK